MPVINTQEQDGRIIGRQAARKFRSRERAMLTARAAVDCIATGRVDKDAIWRINVDDEYQESKE